MGSRQLVAEFVRGVCRWDVHEAPVMKTVLPARRAAPAEKTESDMVRRKVRRVGGEARRRVVEVVSLVVKCLSISLCRTGGRETGRGVPDLMSCARAECRLRRWGSRLVRRPEHRARLARFISTANLHTNADMTA